MTKTKTKVSGVAQFLGNLKYRLLSPTINLGANNTIVILFIAHFGFY